MLGTTEPVIGSWGWPGVADGELMMMVKEDDDKDDDDKEDVTDGEY